VVEMIFIYSKNLNHRAHREHGDKPVPEAGRPDFRRFYGLRGTILLNSP
jgi:hypothetical protein